MTAEGPVGPGAGRRTRWLRVVAVALLAVHASAAWLSRPPGIVTRQDDALYILLGRSLKEGHYQDLSRVDELEHRMYPPVYPALLGTWFSVVGEGHDRGAALSVGLSVVMLAVLFGVVQKVFSPLVAVLSLAVLAVNPFLVRFGGSIATETPFMLFLVGSVALLARPNASARRSVLAAASAIVGTMTRVAGLPLLGAIGVHWLLERRWKRVLVYGVACALTVGVWLAWSASGPELFAGRSYIGDVTAPGAWQAGPRSVVNRVLARIPRYLGQSLPYTLAVPTVEGTPIDNAIGVLIVCTGLLVGIVLLWRKWRVAALTLIAYGLMLFLYTWNAERFIVPMLTVIVPSMLAGFYWIGRRLNETAGRISVAVAAVVLVLSGFARTASAVQDAMVCDRGRGMPDDDCIKLDQVSYFAAVRYIDANIREDAVFLTMKPEPLYYYTGRQSVGAQRALAQPDSTFMSHLRDDGAQYVLLGSLQNREIGRLQKLLLQYCDQLELIQFFPARTYLFRIRPPGELDSEGTACEAMEAHRAANVNRNFEQDP